MIYNPYPQINLPFGRDNKYFKILFDAICNVDKSFVMYKVEDSSYPQVTCNDLQEHVERVFAYELYHRWANLLEKNGVCNLALNGEISKKMIEDSKNEEKSNDKKGKCRSIFPDIVLHASQENDDNQLMICEIKREKDFDDTDFLHDLYKLYKYINDKKQGFVWAKNFQYGIFILVGPSVSLAKLQILKSATKVIFLDETIKWKSFKSDCDDCFRRIICITYDGTVLEYDTLKNIIQGKMINQISLSNELLDS